MSAFMSPRPTVAAPGVFGVAALAVVACGHDELTVEEHYKALTERTSVECGAYAHNYPPDGDPPLHYCGDAPNVACVNDAIEGSAITHLARSYLHRDSLLLREQHFFAGEGSLVYIAYFQVGLDDPAWYGYHCSGVETTSYDVNGMTCWKLVARDCVESE